MEQFIAFLGNHPMLTAAWVGIFLAIVVISVRIKLSPIKQLSPQELTFLVNREEGVVVDIRSEKEFKTARILDAKHLPSEKANKDDFATLEKSKDKPIILVCAAGVSASNVANKMLKAGFSRVSVLKGGMNAWSGAGLPVAK
ncbi:rhodanese-like domain-containing protein [Thalassotalea sp. 1_MG-2023]|uniref:rhodanese-like domain-containing protein n=1 Tax=Thalassotalea sp. 1_MG-2023 TaxID=3062680 RepID=UPI0026E45A25|nr:rhodanese-like domain-containing protein [Thalassotalea sp. 1_MG-2023]MDO6425599.1 rhodanese-like domain-containing protein [Thalassotalea sp. 1_MG-2023]